MADSAHNPGRPSRLAPMEQNEDFLVLTDRQAEDHGEHVRGEVTTRDPEASAQREA